MIQCDCICKAYGNTKVFQDFSCTIPLQAHQMTAILGPSGCGKTTLLRMLARLEKPDSGRIIGLPEQVGMVFQEPRLFAHLTALENVCCVADRETSKRMLSDLQMGHALAKKPAALSGGMQQRVALARALASGRDLLLLDEPFKGLDEALKGLVLQIVKQKVKYGVIVTHDRQEAEALAAQIIEIDPVH